MRLKPFILGLLVAVFVPALPLSASFLVFLKEPGLAAVSSPNSQTLPLLEPAINHPATSRALITDDGLFWTEGGPLGTAANLPETTINDQISLYVTKEGDTLAGVAKMYNISVNTIVWANNLKPNQPLKPGQELVILPISGLEYTVRQGDVLQEIAKRYKADAREIAQFNGLDLEGELIVGTKIIIPDGEIAAPVNIARRGQSLPVYSGYYLRPIVGGRRTQGLHGRNGVDLANRLGTPVLASAPGQVIVSRNSGWNGGYGNYVVLSHPNGTQTVYGHLLRSLVGVGETVERGQQIGELGSSGNSTGPHLHFEIRGAKNPF